MQKTNKKLNVNPVGANCVRPHFEELTLKKQKGITLIALIITIIVMLILVGVTINVALNGGLFSKAEEAAELTTKAAEKEELLMAVVAAIGTDGKVSFEYLDKNLPTDWTGSNGTYTSPKGRIYTVNEKGKIEEGTGSGNRPVEFNWEDVGLIVDTNADYKFYDSRFSTTYIINFTPDGNLIVKADGTVVETYDATEEADGILTIPFTYAGTTYDTTLKMNTNNIDVDAELKGLTTVTYIKVETTYPIAYELKILDLIILETDVDEIILTTRGANGGRKCKFVPCTNVFDLKTNDECNRIVNNTGMNDIGYSKAVINENEVFQGIVYSEELDTWIFLRTNKSNSFGVTDNYYSIESDFFFERIELTQAEIDSIIQSANATNE